MTTPHGWETRALAEFIELQRGFDLPHRTRRAGPYKVLSSGDAHGWHDQWKVTGPGFVVGRATNIGKPTWSDEDFWPLNTTLFAKDFRGNDPRFAYYWFLAHDLSAYNSGSVQPMLNRNYIAKIPIDIPPLAEQRSIAATLGALDDKIESNQRAAILTLALLDAFADSAGSQLPQVPLSELAELKKETAKPSEMGEAQVSHFSLPAFDEGARPEITSASTIKSNKLWVRGKAVLVSRLNPQTNRTWWVEADGSSPAMASTEFAVLQTRQASMLPSVWLAVRDSFFRQELARRVTGTSGSHQRVRPNDMLKIEVPDTRKLTDEDIASAGELLALVENRRAEAQRLASVRDALLPELLSGRLRVPEAREIAA